MLGTKKVLLNPIYWQYLRKNHVIDSTPSWIISLASINVPVIDNWSRQPTTMYMTHNVLATRPKRWDKKWNTSMIHFRFPRWLTFFLASSSYRVAYNPRSMSSGLHSSSHSLQPTTAYSSQVKICNLSPEPHNVQNTFHAFQSTLYAYRFYWFHCTSSEEYVASYHTLRDQCKVRCISFKVKLTLRKHYCLYNRCKTNMAR